MDYPVLHFSTPELWEEWLSKNHTTTPGIWIKFAKKGSGIPSVYYQEALLVALCYGWIDGQAKTYDANYYLQKFTPRTKKSMWSKRNIGLVEQLIQDKKMQEAGLLEIQRAKEDGRWEAAYDSPKNMQVPDDFLTELKKDEKAYSFFQTLSKTNSYAIAFRLQTAKKEETKQKRMHNIIEMLKKGEVFHP